MIETKTIMKDGGRCPGIEVRAMDERDLPVCEDRSC